MHAHPHTLYIVPFLCCVVCCRVLTWKPQAAPNQNTKAARLRLYSSELQVTKLGESTYRHHRIRQSQGEHSTDRAGGSLNQKFRKRHGDRVVEHPGKGKGAQQGPSERAGH
eukprot:1354378-Pyramimonas_sp.AAC.2